MSRRAFPGRSRRYDRPVTRLAKLAWGVLALNVGVVVWGAFVRATGSGAGCGDHWPLCNGEIVPHSPRVETLIELAHRLSSGLALVGVAALVVAAYRHRPASRPLRRAAAAAGVLILSEALVGAGLVLFRLVADNESMARALFMGAHLVNTFLLLGALAIVAHLASGGRPLALGARPALTTLWLVVLGALALAGASGAVAALGDTLHPSRTIAEALAEDLSPASHLLIRLRLLHPVLAASAGILAVVLARFGLRASPETADPRHVLAIELLVTAQVAAGLVNVMLLAPVWLQLVHLTLADAVWIAVVLYGGRLLGPAAAAEGPRR